MVGMSTMSQNMVESFRATAEKMKLVTAKSREKARKRREKDLKKRGLDPNSPAPMSAAKRLALETMNAQAETDTTGGSTGGSYGEGASPAPKPVGKGGTDVAIDDIA